MKVKSVIGLAFGDEGKGLVTDWLCSEDPKNTLCVRFSGGHQAGHTVVKGGTKHVFSSFGSGTLRGVPTYFTKNTCLYPTFIKNEKETLKSKGITPDLSVHPLVYITTPYDIAYNRLMERVKNHGSVGLGIGTTMHRNLTTGYKLYAVDLLNEEIFLVKLRGIELYYQELVHPGMRSEYEDLVSNFEPWFLRSLRNLFTIRNYDYLKQFENLVFEGSQGILLDKDFGFFPNVTYASLTNNAVKAVLDEAEIRSILETFYITRCYSTRHGNGWMPQGGSIDLINNEEETNVFNLYQKDFKVQEFDVKLIKQAMEYDNAAYPGTIKNLVVTCLDQRPDFKFPFKEFDMPIWTSNSPESRNIKKLNYELV